MEQSKLNFHFTYGQSLHGTHVREADTDNRTCLNQQCIRPANAGAAQGPDQGVNHIHIIN